MRAFSRFLSESFFSRCSRGAAAGVVPDAFGVGREAAGLSGEGTIGTCSRSTSWAILTGESAVAVVSAILRWEETAGVAVQKVHLGVSRLRETASIR